MYFFSFGFLYVHVFTIYFNLFLDSYIKLSFSPISAKSFTLSSQLKTFAENTLEWGYLHLRKNYRLSKSSSIVLQGKEQTVKTAID